MAVLLVSAVGVGAATPGPVGAHADADTDTDEPFGDVSNWLAVGENEPTADEDGPVDTDTVVSAQELIEEVLSSLFGDSDDGGDDATPIDGDDDESSDADTGDDPEADDSADSDAGDDADEPDADVEDTSESSDETDDSVSEELDDDSSGAVDEESDDDSDANGAGADGDGDDSSADENDDALDRALVERFVHEAVNEERTAHGLEELAFDDELRDVARSHSEDMAERGYFAHDDPDGNTVVDRYEAHGYECRADAGGGAYYTGGENIAYTYVDQPVRTASGEVVQHTDERELAAGVVDQWMNSEGHRENLLDDHWTAQGIGVHVTDENRVYATQNFC